MISAGALEYAVIELRPESPMETFVTAECRRLAVFRLLLVVILLMLASAAAWPQAAPPKPTTNDYSGMYSFLREGEFVEVDVEPDGKVGGFISRYGDGGSDRGAFLDHLFTQGSLHGNKLAFTTRSVHGVSFEFSGDVQRGEGKLPGSEGYWVIKGTLKRITEDKDHNKTAQEREVTFKSFPADVMMPAKQKD